MDETTVMPRAELLSLVSLPPSAELAGRLAWLEGQQAAGKPVHGLQLVTARRRIELGAERDRLQSQRPEGCWCLGLGQVEGRWCECPDAVAARAEQAAREARRRQQDVESFVARAGIPRRYQEASFATFPGRPFTGLQRARSWRPTQEKPGLFLWGDYGTGKTGIAVSVLRAYVEREASSALFLVMPELLESIRQGFDREGSADETPAVLRAIRAPFLVLDDMGAERPGEWVTEVLYRVVNTRYNELRTTVFTSNLELDALPARLGARTTWRIAEMCEFIEIAGANLRAPAARGAR